MNGDGSVATAHCTCMAGAGEACSHVGATLFAVETAVRIRDSSTCTQMSNKWLPAYTPSVEYKRIRDIDFTSSKSKKRRLQGCGEDEVAVRTRDRIPEPTQDELCKLYDAFSTSEVKPSVLLIIEGRNETFPPPQAREPTMLRGIYTQEALSDTLDKLVERAEDFSESLIVTTAMVKFVESTTRTQSKCAKWFAYRAGRITASVMKAACSTSIEKPSLSLLKRICYPEESKFSTPATRWGVEHEAEAMQCYVGKVKSGHSNFTHRRAGLYLSAEHPHVAASPDSVVQCDCCGNGLVEVKCPYTWRESVLHSPTELDPASCSHTAVITDPSTQCDGCKSGLMNFSPENSGPQGMWTDHSFCLERVDGRLLLKREHAYFFQVQAQMAICDAGYCDFVVWTVKDVHVERVFRDSAFWDRVLLKVTKLFIHVVLPELLSHYFTRSTAPEAEQGHPSSSFCFCGGPESGKMVACDANGCKYKWFHFTCLGITRAPKKRHWYCPDCEAAK